MGKEHRILFDSGLGPMTVIHNAKVLGFDLSSCELVISSHGHIDHAGGLVNIRKNIEARKKQKIPLVLHNDAFRNRMVKLKDNRTINLPSPNKSDLIQAGYYLVEKQSPSLWVEDSILVQAKYQEPMILKKDFLIIIRR